MSMYFQEHGKIEVRVPGVSLTKQAFKDECDIQKILAKAQKTGSIAHLTEHEGTYGDFAGYDLMEHAAMLSRASEIFDDLPSEIRNEFSNEPAAFFEFVNDPENKDRLGELMPALAEPGSYFPDVSSKTDPKGTMEPVKAEKVKEEPKVEVEAKASD